MFLQNGASLFVKNGKIKRDPVQGAAESFQALCACFDTYVLFTALWNNLSVLSDKLLWIKGYLGDKEHKCLFLRHHKNLNTGHFWVDDRFINSADGFVGEHILPTNNTRVVGVSQSCI